MDDVGRQLLITVDLTAPPGPGDVEDLRRLLLHRVPGAVRVDIITAASVPLGPGSAVPGAGTGPVASS